MKKTIAIVQSNYIPWKGYFDLIRSVDEFVLYDEVQFTKRDWRNRNVIKTSNGLFWLSIPVVVKGKYSQRICDTQIADNKWAEKHWNTIRHNYKNSKYFILYKDIFEDLYLNSKENYLSEINFRFIKSINKLLNINTEIKWSSDYKISEGKTQKLLDICKESGATEYYSGPAAKGYMDENLFEKENIKIKYADYNNYPEYPQLYPPFEHKVSILDLLFNVGDKAVEYLKYL